MRKTLSPDEYPPGLHEIPEPPSKLRLEGALPPAGHKLLAIVGARKFSPYGREICESLVAGLAGSPVSIVSGLALGIDSIAHRAALRHGLHTLALPGSGLDRSVIHPRSHAGLADDIVAQGGGLLSEYDDLMPSGVWAFPRRNRLIAGICEAAIIIEAEKKSGTLITARLAAEYNREVGAVPGSLYASTSEGPHLLLRLGAALIRDANDVLELLGLPRRDAPPSLMDIEGLTSEEKTFIKLLEHPCERDELIRKSKLPVGTASAVLSLLEIKGLIAEEMGEVRKTF